MIRDFPYDFMNSTPAHYGLHNSTICGTTSTLPHPNLKNAHNIKTTYTYEELKVKH
jgi:hypothetical protein